MGDDIVVMNMVCLVGLCVVVLGLLVLCVDIARGREKIGRVPLALFAAGVGIILLAFPVGMVYSLLSWR